MDLIPETSVDTSPSKTSAAGGLCSSLAWILVAPAGFMQGLSENSRRLWLALLEKPLTST